MNTASQMNQKDITRVLDSLERWSDRLNGHCNEKRGSVRRPFRKEIVIFIPSGEQTGGEANAKTVIQGWSRNLSQSGISFIYQSCIEDEIIVVLLKSPTHEPMFLDAKIVRRRQVHAEFWEYGAEFQTCQIASAKLP